MQLSARTWMSILRASILKMKTAKRNGETKNNLDFSAYISVLQSLVDSKSLELWAE